MRCALSVIFATLMLAAPAHAGGPYPAVPPELGVAPFIGPTWEGYRCAEDTIYNFYHGAYYGEEPPAIYRGYTYRPHYRYSAYRGRADISASLTERCRAATVGRRTVDVPVPESPFEQKD